MYAHITTGHIDPDQLDTYLENIRTHSLVAVKGQPGYKAALFLTDPQSGKFIGIAFFQTEADRQALEDSGFADAQRSRTGSLLNLIRDEPAFYQVSLMDGTFHTDGPVHIAPLTNDNVSTPPCSWSNSSRLKQTGNRLSSLLMRGACLSYKQRGLLRAALEQENAPPE